MGTSCSDILDVIPETVVLAFDVAGWTDPKDAERIARSKEIAKAINEELASQGKQLVEKHFTGKTITQADALKMLSDAGSKFTDDRKHELSQRISRAYHDAPLGVWLDKHSWVLYVFVPLVVGAAGTWMYVAQVGDLPASWATSIGNVKKDWNVQKLGKITLGTQDLKFIPSKREWSGKAMGMLAWERLSIRITLGGGMVQDRFTGASVECQVTTSVTRELEATASSIVNGLGANVAGSSSVGLKYKGSGAGATLSLSLAGLLEYQREGLSSLGGAASAGVRGALGRTPAALDLTGQVKQNLRPNQPAGECSVMLKLTFGF